MLCRAAIGNIKGINISVLIFKLAYLYFKSSYVRKIVIVENQRQRSKPGKGQKTGLGLKRHAEELKRSHVWWERTVGGGGPSFH